MFRLTRILAMSVFATSLALSFAAAPRTPVVFDTDIATDIDDTWALAHLLRPPELDLKLVLTETGDARYPAAVAAKLLETAGRTDVAVGLGTFRPITTETIAQHSIHQEPYELPVETQRLVCRADGGRRIAVGTTTVRSVEDFLAGHTAPLDRPYRTATELFIHPPHTFRGVDVLITNFHQPRSTRLCLVAAFLSPGSTDGIAWIRGIYAEAIAREYRFFSYGDAMLIL